MIATTPPQLHDGWPVASPENASLDPQALHEITQALENGYEYPNVHAVLIEHAGKLVYEHYLDGEDGSFGDRRFNVDSLHDLRSVSKSVTALLLGIAFGDDIEEALATPIIEFFGDRVDAIAPEAGSINLHHVLTMTAGFEWDQSSSKFDPAVDDEAGQYYSQDPIGFVLRRPVVAAPGSRWVYSSGLTELLVPIIENRTGKSLREFACDNLFLPLGIENFEWLSSWHWTPGSRPSGGWGLRLRPRDLARIGSLILHNGFWQGKSLVSSNWVRQLGQRHVEEAPAGNSLYGYGYQWWAVKSGSIPPYNIVGGFGRGGQRLLIVPEHHLVLTVLAGNYASYQQDMGNRILHRVIAAHRIHGQQ